MAEKRKFVMSRDMKLKLRNKQITKLVWTHETCIKNYILLVVCYIDNRGQHRGYYSWHFSLACLGDSLIQILDFAEGRGQ